MTDEQDELLEDEAPEPSPPTKASREATTPRRTTGGTPGTSRGPTPRGRAMQVDPALRVRDRASEAFVIGTVLVFAAIFLNALAFGQGGAFSTSPAASPTVSATEAPTVSFSPTPGIPTPFSVPSRAPSPGASVESPAAS